MALSVILAACLLIGSSPAEPRASAQQAGIITGALSYPAILTSPEGLCGAGPNAKRVK